MFAASGLNCDGSANPAGYPCSAGRNDARGRVGLVDDRVDDLRTVDRQHVAAAGAAEVHVADAVAAADRRARTERIGEAEARPEVVAVRIDQRAVRRAIRPTP